MRTMFQWQSGERTSIMLWIGGVLLLVSVTQVGCENSTVRDSSPESQNTDSERAIDKGMTPLYTMTNWFLDLVQPEGRGNLVDTYDLDSEEYEDIEGVFTSIGDAFTDDWQTGTKLYIGFVICAAVGVAFILIMPIVGLIFCCCRCCGHCGAKGSHVEKSGDKCRRICCGLSLAILNTLILAGMVCAFVTNELLREQTAKDSGEALVPKMAAGVRQFDNYLANTVKEIETALTTDLEISLDGIIQTLKDTPQEALNKVSELTNSEQVLDAATSLVDSVNSINSSLHTVNSYTEQLETKATALLNDLNREKDEIIDILDNCPTQQCDDLKAKVNAIQLQQQYDSLPDLRTQQTNVQDVLNSNLSQLVEAGREQYEDIQDDVLADTEDILDEVEQEVEEGKDSVLEEAKTQSDEIKKQVNDLLLNDTESKLNNEYGDKVDKYGNYRYYAGIGLSCVLLLIVLFNYLGLCFGACGEAPDEGASGCNRGVGATVLMVGVGFAFVFCWLLMLVVLVLFLAGGTVYTEGCRPISRRHNSGLLPLADLMIDSSFDEDLGLSIHTILQNCSENGPIYQVLNLAKIANLTEILDLSKYDVRGQIDRLVAQVNVDTSGIVIISGETKQQLETLRDSSIDSITYQEFYDQLDMALFGAPNLTEVATELDQVAATVTDDDVKQDLQDQAQDLRDLQSLKVEALRRDAAVLRGAVESLENEVQRTQGSSSFSDKTQELINQLEAAQANVQSNGTRFIKEFVSDFANNAYDQMDLLLDNLEYELTNNVGKCEPAYDALAMAVTDSFCDDFLDPFNGFWFSIAWCLLFFIPSIILAVVLAGLYRKTDLYFDEGHKSFDDPLLDEVKGPSYSRRKYKLLPPGYNSSNSNRTRAY